MKETRYLECVFTPDEVIEMRKKISINITELRRREDTLTSLNKQLKGEIALLSAETQLLAEKANSGKEMRSIEVQSKTDWKKSRLTVTRLDTGEVIENRPLRNDELQTTLIEE